MSIGKIGSLAIIATGGSVVAFSCAAGYTSEIADPVSHCSGNETVIYSCSFQDAETAQTASVCLGKNRISYRYGALDRPALENPDRVVDSDPEWSNIHLGSVIGGSGGHQTHIRFSSQDGEEIIVFEGAPGQYHDGTNEPWSGVTILLPDATEHRHECASPLTGILGSMQADTLMRAQAPPKVYQDRSIYEEEGGLFDGWF